MAAQETRPLPVKVSSLPYFKGIWLVRTLQSLKMNTKIENPATCKVIRFLRWKCISSGNSQEDCWGVRLRCTECTEHEEMVSVVQRRQDKCAGRGTKWATVFGHERSEIKKWKRKFRKTGDLQFPNYTKIFQMCFDLRVTKSLWAVCKAQGHLLRWRQRKAGPTL